MKNKVQYAAPPRTRKELKAIFDSAIKDLKAMSPHEIFATLVRSGIYTKNGKLRKEYGGPAQ